eukprot:TRINITY_DN47653_c0_g1_i1.p1 TRINITY_DN47653_c0_g1~~TRINITY_DN47653_c0_g1_i1.p1  ORF type:complete len:149 (+),score=34.54 TRINITY_DN47653_c0_g1_i1:150-596(+)
MSGGEKSVQGAVSPRARTTWIWSSLVGTTVEVACADGTLWRGVLMAKKPTDMSVVLAHASPLPSKQCKLTDKSKLRAALHVPAAAIVAVTASDVAWDFDESSPKRPPKNSPRRGAAAASAAATGGAAFSELGARLRSVCAHAVTSGGK